VKPLGSLTAAALTLAVMPAVALAESPRPVAASAAGGVTYAGTTGGASYGEPTVSKPKPAPKKKPSSVAARPVLESFAVAPAVLTPGQTPSVSFEVKGRAPTIRLRLVVSFPGTTHPERQVDLGRLRANVAQTVPLPSLADATLPEGQVSVRIAGRDSAGRILRPAAHMSRVASLQVRAHVFPLLGVFSYGTAANRFGSGRTGHIHQGQDLLAAEGVPVVAPRAGTIEYVQYQAGGAGWYVVLDGEGEDLDYAFMHLQEGSIPVVKGQHVDQGQRIGSVGHTGDAEGDHLHFEIWQGPWFNGGHAVDPLPYLQQWQQWSPVRAT
jgi:murein DD-endopeptidase MepM/ murein hydrolase activator NlpD